MNLNNSASGKSNSKLIGFLFACFVCGILYLTFAKPDSPPDSEASAGSRKTRSQQVPASKTDPETEAYITNTMQRASLALKDLIQTHPRKEIKEDLNSLIENGSIALNFQTQTLDASHAIATLQLIKAQTNRLYLTLIVSSDALLSDQYTKIFKQLVIFHEYQHYLQYKDGRIPQWQLFARRADVPLSEEEIRVTFASESEAYEAECILAEELRALNEFEFCKAYATGGRSQLRIALAETYAALPHYTAHAPLLRSLATQ